MKDTLNYLRDTDFPPIKRGALDTLQVNMGYLCNQQCIHCHVDAGPRRKEIMNRETIDCVLSFLHKHNIHTLDLTGGAPEMNPHFQFLIRQARKSGVHVIDRCNLTILTEPGNEDLAAFLASHQVEVTASLPCYLQENVDAQRGKGVFEKSIQGLKYLNQQGYGSDKNLPLNLVYNPQGINLPPAQDELEHTYKQMLNQRYGITFNQLFTMANMPIKRFGSMLLSKGKFAEYMQQLKQSYRADNLDSVMCRSTLSVDWQGFAYDCDFNQMLTLPAGLASGKKHLDDLLQMNFYGREISIMDHCYGCTAGQGSSCGGALVNPSI